MYVASASQMKKYDQRLLDEGYTIELLVDKARDCILPYIEEYQKIAIISGVGNNGADGIALAIKLWKQRKQVMLYLVGDFSTLSKANKKYLEEAKKLQVPTLFVESKNIIAVDKQLKTVDVIVDAIFGFGLHSSPKGIVKDIIPYINNKKIPVIAIDIPTGLNCDTGKPYESVVYASQTITLTALKQGFLNVESQKYTGRIFIELLQIKDFREAQGLAKMMEESWVIHQLQKRDFYGHKGTYGKVLHITGSAEYKGAALLSAKASVYTGSGIVTSYSVKEVITILPTFVPECTCILREVDVDMKICNSYTALLIGCGLGLKEQSYQQVEKVLQEGKIPLVIDADALTIVTEYQNLLKKYSQPVILTPHIGEFKRFMPYVKEGQLVEVAKQFAEEHNVILVLKGPNTIITDGSIVFRNTTGNAAMATAGMGDVLAGIITSLLGQGYSAKHAAMLGVYIH